MPSQDYSAKVRETSPQLTEDGYEMPFSPGVPPQQMVPGARQSMASPQRFTSRQMEYMQTVGAEDSAGSYLPMSADRTDNRTVFDFDNETVAFLTGRRDKEANGGDLYMRMDKLTPQQSPAPDTPNKTVSKSREESPRRLVLKSISSVSSQGGGRHHPLTKHDSGVYSPTVMTQTNPGYMSMTPLMPAYDHNNYVNSNMVKPEVNGCANANIEPTAERKARDYMADGKNVSEYANLLPQDSGRGRSLSDSSSGIGSIKDDSPPRLRGGSVHKAPPTLQEVV